MKYIDSSVFIGAFLPTDTNHKICRRVMDTIIRDRMPTAISVFGLAEIDGFFTRNMLWLSEGEITRENYR
ncbi:MAG: hypothetical protein ACXQTR_06690 [Candidatus Methanospirareceae archaeon]